MKKVGIVIILSLAMVVASSRGGHAGSVNHARMIYVYNVEKQP